MDVFFRTMDRCKYCGHICDSDETLQQHEDQDHNFPCPLCTGRKFTSKEALDLHMKRNHKWGSHPCGHCTQTFEDPRLLQYHRLEQHPGLNTYHETPAERTRREQRWARHRLLRPDIPVPDEERSGFKGKYTLRFLTPTIQTIDVEEAILNLANRIKQQLQGKIYQRGSIRWIMPTLVKFKKYRYEANEEEQTDLVWFCPEALHLSSMDNFLRQLQHIIDTLINDISTWLTNGSFWVVHEIVGCDVGTMSFNRIKGGAYLPIPNNLPGWRTKSLVNVQTERSCLKYSILASLFCKRLPKGKEKEDRIDRKSTRLNSSHSQQSRMPSSA